MDTWTDRLSEYLDGALPAAERAALEAHLEGCAACAATLEELRRVVARARGLEDRPPASDLWPGVAERIGFSPGVTSLSGRRRARRFSFSMPQLAAAAVLLLLAGSAAGYVALRSRSGETAQPPSPGGPTAGAVPAVWAERAAASQDSAVALLRAALEVSRADGQLDSATVRVIEQSLATIDSAIAQAQRALAADPSSAYLNQHLAETLRRKSQFLRRASALVTPRTL